MRLSEALIQRADLQKRIHQLDNRLRRSARVQEDEQPPEDPQDLLTELNNLIPQLTTVVAQINHTNSITTFDGTRTLTDVLAKRDSILLQRKILEHAIQASTGRDERPYRYLQIKSFSTLNVRDVQSQIDSLSQQYRELDTRIQELNWTTELIE